MRNLGERGILPLSNCDIFDLKMASYCFQFHQHFDLVFFHSLSFYFKHNPHFEKREVLFEKNRQNKYYYPCTSEIMTSAVKPSWSRDLMTSPLTSGCTNISACWREGLSVFQNWTREFSSFEEFECKSWRISTWRLVRACTRINWCLKNVRKEKKILLCKWQ